MRRNAIFGVLAVMLLLPMLSGCQLLGSTRAQFCDSLRSVDSVIGQLKDSKVVATVGQLRQHVKTIRDALSTVAAVAPSNLGINFDGLIKSLDDLEKATLDLPDDMPVQDALSRIGGAADEVKKQYDAVYNDVCAAK